MPRRRYSLQLSRSDLDVHGQVDDLTFLHFLEDARVQLLVDLGAATGPPETGQRVLRNEIDYDLPMDLDAQPVVLDVWVSQVGDIAYEVRYEVLDRAGTVFVRARTAVLRIDPDTGRTVDLDPELRRLLESNGGRDGELIDATATATVGRLAPVNAASPPG